MPGALLKKEEIEEEAEKRRDGSTAATAQQGEALGIVFIVLSVLISWHALSSSSSSCALFSTLMAFTLRAKS